MELEEAEDEEWYTTSSKYSFKNNAGNGCKVRRWLLKRGLCLGIFNYGNVWLVQLK